MKNKAARVFIYFLWKQKQFSHKEIIKIKYALDVISNEMTKLIPLLIFFIYVKDVDLFIFSVAVLLPVRIFSGGLHFKSSIKCFLFTCVFFIGIYYFSVFFTIEKNAPSLALALLILASIIALSPAPNDCRPVNSDEKTQRFRIIVFSITLIWLIILFLFVDNSTYFTVGFITLSLQSIQLIIAYIVRNINIKKRRVRNEIINQSR